MTSPIGVTLQRVAQGLGCGADARILVLGDPSAQMCGELADDWSSVSCCPDRQGTAGADHRGYVIGELEPVIQLGADFDVVIAVAGWRRMQDVRSKARLEELLDWMAAHARAVIMEAPRTVLAPDLHDLGPYDVVGTLGRFSFVTELDVPALPFGFERPIIVASSEGALLPDGWLSAAEFALISTTDAPKPNPVRTFLSTDAVLKLDFACPDYFHQSPALGEIEFLTRVTADQRDALDLPTVRQVVRGRSVSAVLRDAVPGEPLQPGAFRTNVAGISATIRTAAAMAKFGIFHNDLRPWNLLWDGSSVRFIDFADAGWSDRDVQHVPQALAFAATLAGLMTEELAFGEPFLQQSMDRAETVGMGSRWWLENLIDEPWRALPGCADRLISALGTSESHSAAAIMTIVINELTDVTVPGASYV